MPATRLHWDAQALQQRLQAVLPSLQLQVLAQAGSTSTVLLDRARESGATPCLLVAEHQTRGRGRLGRAWLAAPGQSLTFSLLLPLAPVDWAGLSLAVGLALADALDSALDSSLGSAQHGALNPPAPPRIGIKWPNDLWLMDSPGRGRKLGGILIETVSQGAQRLCVVGVGLNILPSAGMAAAELSQGHACLQELDAAASAPAALARVAEPLLRTLLGFRATGFAPRVAAYAQRDVLRGHPITTTLAGLPAGVAEGVDGIGALLVRRGSLHRVVSGEVSVRLDPKAP